MSSYRLVKGLGVCTAFFLSMTMLGACTNDEVTGLSADTPTNSPGTVYSGPILRLDGRGTSLVLNFNLNIAAVSLADGTVHGHSQVVRGIAGPVVELVPPSPSFNHWCVNVAIDNVPDVEGLNVLWYIRDIGDGKTSFDELAFRGGLNVTCADIPAPTDPFVALDNGDFRGTVAE